MPITSNIQKRARKSIAPTRPPIIPPPSTNVSSDRTVCHLCGYLGRTKSISIEKNCYHFLRHLPPAPGALPVNDNTHHIRACHLCVLLLDKQRELNHTSTNFFFKGFFRSTGSCHKIQSNSIDEQERSPGKRRFSNKTKPYAFFNKEIPIEVKPISSPQTIISEQQSRSIPPPLRKTSPTTLDFQISDELSSLDSFITSIRSRFSSEYTTLTSSLKNQSYDSCQLCLSVKPPGTLYSISKTQFDFLSSSQMNICTLCYFNLMDQYKKQMKTYHRPRPECYLCHCYIKFIDWEIKLLETEYFPFLFNLSNHEQLYDNQRLALTCDQCFYRLLFQYIDQQRQNIPIQQRTYTWQCIYSYENEQILNNTNDLFYISSSSSSNKTL